MLARGSGRPRSYAQAFQQPPAPPEELKSYCDLGIRPKTALTGDVSFLVDVASAHVELRDWSSALACYKRALELVGSQPGLEATVAAIRLNLGAVCVQAGDTQDARTHLAMADRFYTSAQDKVGQAQVALNLAVAAARDGQPAAANEQLTNASTLLAATAERLGVTREEPAARPGPPLRPGRQSHCPPYSHPPCWRS